MDYINLNLLPVKLDEDVEIPEDFYEGTAIKGLKNIHVKGLIDYNISGNVAINLKITGEMLLLDAITLEEVIYPLDIDIDDTIDALDGENNEYFEKNKNILDKLEFLWENIVLEVPISFTKASGAKMHGDGWELNKEDDEEIDPRLAKLNDLFKGGE